MKPSNKPSKINLLSSGLRSTFSIDHAALALFRIGLGLLLLVDLVLRLGDLEMFYSDRGVLPRSVLLTAHSAANVGPSIHLASGAVWFQGLLFLVSCAFAICLMVGYKTKLSTIVCWLLYISLGSRNPGVVDGSDFLIRLMLFWSMFLPLGVTGSLDAAIRRRDRKADGVQAGGRVMSVAAAALLIQVALVYWVTAVLKTGPTWREGTALYYALSLEHLATPAGAWLSQHTGFCAAMTHLTILIEYAGPFLLLAPLRWMFVRQAAVLVFAGFHLGIAITMKFGLFPWGDLVALIPFLHFKSSAGIIARIDGVMDRIARVPGTASRAGPPPITPRPQTHPQPWVKLATNAVAAFFLVYILWWNAGVIDPRLSMPKPFKEIAYQLKIYQKWNMFAPNPGRRDGWFVVMADLSDGSKIDLLRGGTPVSWDKPRHFYGDFKGSRGRKYLTNLLSPGSHESLKVGLAEYLRRQWYEAHPGTRLRIRRVKIYYAHRSTLPDHQHSQVKYRMLYQWDRP